MLRVACLAYRDGCIRYGAEPSHIGLSIYII
jgi:hypothetical protein